MTNRIVFSILLLSVFLFSCADNEALEDSRPDEEETTEAVYILPVVVHIIHTGEETGTGYNLSEERIIGQIKTLNDDFRKKPGTLGYNTHPLGTDAKIEFKFAEIDPDGNPTSGITRINGHDVSENTDDVDDTDSEGWFFDTLPKYGYWDTQRYINIWVFPFEPNRILGQASFPKADIAGLEDISASITTGIVITSPHFGTSDLEGGSNLGRSLTHEMGHFLGLEHLWGKIENADCAEYDDYCEDTPLVSRRTKNCDNGPPSCGGEPALTQNYMDYTDDSCMNMFTKDQVARMRYVLENSPVQSSLKSSTALQRPSMR
ncbi:hypothetical protein FUAX_36540 [Fulvitalea axinellae]|uniref:Peptidase M43 pregnancy-associated plasma-A domain-containing protein n=1 Tax=Fulvitalea axinellae TaxID=1182444 RepID=A0AAU9CW19_9BACT|nr:hypothetical protein FUAX_36540 [Fulvitalea axinellae]